MFPKEMNVHNVMFSIRWCIKQWARRQEDYGGMCTHTHTLKDGIIPVCRRVTKLSVSWRKTRRNTSCHNIYTTCNNPADVCECRRVWGVCDACVTSRVSSMALSHDLIQRIQFFSPTFFQIPLYVATRVHVPRGKTEARSGLLDHIWRCSSATSYGHKQNLPNATAFLLFSRV